MGIRRNIIISLILHAALIAASFSVNNSVNNKERACPLLKDVILVSVVEEITATTSIASSPVSPYQDSSASLQTCPERDSSVTLFPQNDRNRRNDIRRRDDKGEGVRNDTPAHHFLFNSTSENSKVGTTILVNQHAGISEETSMLHSNTKEDESNPPPSPFDPSVSLPDGRQAGPLAKGGIKGGIGKSRSGDEILESIKKGASKGYTSQYAIIRTAIERAKSYPFLARKRGIEGTVLVSFKVDRKGSPQDIKIIKNSGYQILDEEVPKMLRKASPFPELNGEIVIPITFKLIESTSEH